MCRVIAIASVKGGVGKTTTTANLSAALAERGCRVLAVDLDPQASLSIVFGHNPRNLQPTIYDALKSTAVPLSSAIRPTREGFDLVPTNHQLNNAVDLLEGEHARTLALRAVLEPVKSRYDYILIDCPANAGILTGNALAAANEVVIPLAPDHLAFQSLEWFLSIIRQVIQIANPNLKIAGVVFTMCDPKARHTRNVMDMARRVYGPTIPFYFSSIQYSESLRDASMAGKTILQYAPESVGGDGYRRLAREIEMGPRETTENELYFVLERGRNALERNDLKNAYSYYCRATELDPRWVQAWTGRAKSAISWDERIRCHAQALALQPSDNSLRDNLEHCLTQAFSDKNVRVHELVTSAHYLDGLGQKGYANKLFSHVVDVDKRHEEAWLGRSRTVTSLLEARTILEQYLTIARGSEAAKMELSSVNERARAKSAELVDEALVLNRQGHRDESQRQLVLASQLDPLNDRAWVGQARGTKDVDAALELVRRALKINPQNDEARELHNLLYNPDDLPSLFDLFEWQRLVLPLLVILVLLAIFIAFILWQNGQLPGIALPPW